MNKKLYRDEYHKVLGGVCSGLAEYFEMDVTVIRLLFAFTVIIMGVGIIPYIVLWMVLPKKGYLYNQYHNPTVDYTVPPQGPEDQSADQGNNAFSNNPFINKPFANRPFTNEPFVNKPFTNNPFGGNPVHNMPQKQKSNAGIIAGVVLIILGAAILMDEYDLIPDFDFGRLWPIIIVFVGCALIVSGQKKQPWQKENWHTIDNAEKENETTDNATNIEP